MIEIHDLQVRKGDRAICTVPRFSAKPGEQIAVVGANGSGKSTLLRVLAGLELKFEGKVDVACSRLDRVLVQQSPVLFRGTVESNVRYGLRARGLASSEADARVREWMQRFGLEQIQSATVANLSGGERRRVALARALVLRPALLLLDEPASDLDADGRRNLQEVLAGESGMTMVVAAPEAESTLLDDPQCYPVSAAPRSAASKSS